MVRTLADLSEDELARSLARSSPFNLSRLPFLQVLKKKFPDLQVKIYLYVGA